MTDQELAVIAAILLVLIIIYGIYIKYNDDY